jgi:hypothetical protein
MSCGIYKLKFKNTHKVYIGQSKNIEYRWIKHKYDLKSGTSSKKLQEAYKEYGIPDMEILLLCEESDLLENETEAIIIYNSIGDGFNTLLPIMRDSSLSPEYSNGCKYSKESIIEVFEYITKFPELTYGNIQELTGVNISTISMIASGWQHTWLKTEFKDIYDEYINNTSTRTHIKQNKNLDKFIMYVRMSNACPNAKSTKEFSNILNISCFRRPHRASDLNDHRLGKTGYRFDGFLWRIWTTQNWQSQGLHNTQGTHN